MKVTGLSVPDHLGRLHAFGPVNVKLSTAEWRRLLTVLALTGVRANSSILDSDAAAVDRAITIADDVISSIPEDG